MDSKEHKVQSPPLLDLVLSFAPALALKSVVLLKIPDIIASADADPDSSLSLRQIAARLPTQTPHLDYLSRILRYLSTQGIFTESQTSSDPYDPLDFRYGLTDIAKCYFVSKNENNPFSMVPALLMETHEKLMMPWLHFHECVLEGQGCDGAFKKAHGKDIWAYSMDDPELNTVVNNALTSLTNIQMPPFLSCYEGFKPGEKLTVVDVGGGKGLAIAQIVEAYPHIHGINFDLPRVIATAPSIPGVEHVEGDMFESIPSGDVIFMKQILHDWDDDQCAKILENCHKVLPKNGRIVVVEIVMSSDQQNPMRNIHMISDLLMLAHTNGGKERNEQQWRRLFETSGFSPPNIGPLGNTHFSILEITKSESQPLHSIIF